MAEPEDTIDLDALDALYARGLAHEAAGERAQAVEAYRAALALDPVDRAGMALRLAALGAAPPPARAPRLYVEMLFDEHAAAFDAHMVGELGYDVPQQMRALLLQEAPGPHPRLLDLGCGTGLVGAALAGLYGSATGLDLSAAMLERAAARGCYDTLLLGEATAALAAWAAQGNPPFDLVAAADVLIYLGDLAPVLAAVAGVLAPGGRLVLSTETLGDDPEPGWRWRVVSTRFAHSEGYLRAALGGAGFAVRSLARVRLREQAGRPVPGLLVLAERA